MSDAGPTSSTSEAEHAALLAGQRLFGIELLQQMGVMLRLPQVATSTACVSFHRFFRRKSMYKHDVRHIALGALFLASKVEETPRRMRDVLAVYLYLDQKRRGLPPRPLDIHSARYIDYKDILIKTERELLKELGFVLYTEHPHKFILNYAKMLTADEATHRKLSQYAWNFVNDSMRTDVCLHYAPEVIVCAAIWLGARVQGIRLPSTDAVKWWDLFDTRKEDMDAVCQQVTHLYSSGKARYVDLRQVARPPKPAPGVEPSPGASAAAAAAFPADGGDEPLPPRLEPPELPEAATESEVAEPDPEAKALAILAEN